MSTLMECGADELGKSAVARIALGRRKRSPCAGVGDDPEQGTVADFPVPLTGSISLVQNLYNVDNALRGRELVVQARGVSHAEGKLAIQKHGDPHHIRVQVFRRYLDEPSEIPVRMGSVSLRVR